METRRYWDGLDWLGRRRYRGFSTNIYKKGLLGRFIGLGHLVALMHGRDLGSILNCQTLDGQKLFFRTEIAPLFEKRLVKWFTNRRMSLYGLGIPPAQYAKLCDGQPMAQVLGERLERLACGFALHDNYFAWQAFGRCYAPNASGPLPPYLHEANFATLRRNAARARVVQASLTDALNAMPEESVDRFVLLDAQDWMSDRQLDALWSAITAAATREARVIFRTAGVETILPGRVAPETLRQWHYLDVRSRELGGSDRSSIYGGFHVYERAG
jgi:S-adenosylmethionine-diacylglycerol 3-amino-3-carboxypropyl transferase